MTGDAPHLRADFDALAAIGADPAGGWSRPAYGPEECAAHEWFAARARTIGMSVRQDAFGNSIARLAGADDLPVLVIGSHLDTVAQGGLYDGALGVLAGLEVARRIAGDATRQARPLEVIAFRDEEGRFGAFTGSRAMAGQLSEDALARMRAADGAVLGPAMAAAGLTPARADAARRDMSGIAAYLELHIEQGPVLEAAGEPLGVVTAIAGQERFSVRFTGEAGHAGTTPMTQRHDAFAAAARFADRFREMILAEGKSSARGTIGIVKLSPNQGNVIPSEVTLGLEIRDISAELLADLAARVAVIASEAAEAMGVTAQCRRSYGAAPVPMNAGLIGVIEDAARAAGFAAPRLPSGANHDAGVIGALVPAAMLFVPSVGGLSHVPEEHTDWPHIVAATGVLETVTRRLLGARDIPSC